MKIQVTSTFGNFTYTAEANVDVTEPISPLVQLMLENGLLQAVQRTPASAAESYLVNELGIPGIDKWAKNGRGTPQRPKGFERSSIPYSEEVALELQDAFGTSVKIGEGENKMDLAYVITSVTENESGSAVSMKRATALVDLLFSTDESRKALFDMLTVLGLKNATTASRETLIAFAHSKGLGSK